MFDFVKCGRRLFGRRYICIRVVDTVGNSFENAASDILRTNCAGEGYSVLINISEHIGHLVDGSSVKPEVRSLRLVFCLSLMTNSLLCDLLR